jgi:hypothetical protein
MKLNKTFWMVGILIILCLSMIPIVMAFEFDNIKEITQTETSKYPLISIVNFYGLGSKIIDYELTRNTDSCMTNCEAEGSAFLYEKNSLFTGIRFEDIKKSNKAIDSKFWLKDTFIEIVPKEETKEECTASASINSTGKYDRNCVNIVMKRWNETRVSYRWIEYKGEILEPGLYEWKITGKKKINESIDWIAYNGKFEFIEWAWWDSNWHNRKAIMVESNVSFVNEPIVINITEIILATNNCSKEIAVTDETDTQISRVILDYSRQADGDGSESCLIQFAMTKTANINQTYYVYYNNAAADETYVQKPVIWSSNLDNMYESNRWSGGTVLNPKYNSYDYFGPGAAKTLNGVNTTIQTSYVTVEARFKVNENVDGTFHICFKGTDGALGYWGIAIDELCGSGGGVENCDSDVGLAIDMTRWQIVRWFLYNTTHTGGTANGMTGDLWINPYYYANPQNNFSDTAYMGTGTPSKFDAVGGMNVSFDYVYMTGGWKRPPQKITLGIEETPALEPMRLNLSYPSNNTFWPSSTIDFNWTIISDVNSTNMTCWHYINNAINSTNACGNGTLCNVQVTGMPNGYDIPWRVNCTDGTLMNFSLVRRLTVDSNFPSLTLNMPLNNSFFPFTTADFNWTASDILNTTNMTCKLNVDSAFNKTKACGNNVLCNQQVTGLSNGTHSWNVNCTDIVNINISISRNFYLDTGILYYLQEKHSSEVISGQSQIMNLNVSFSNWSVSMVSAALTYNNTNYAVAMTNISGNFTVFTSSFTTPLTSYFRKENFTWNISIWMLNGSFMSQSFSYIQNVSELSIGGCGPDNISLVLNITIWNETIMDSSPFNATIQGTFYIWENDRNVNISLNLDTFANNTYICITPNTTAYHTDAHIAYYSDNSPLRSYYLVNATLNVSSRQEIRLYLLSKDLDDNILFYIYDAVNQPMMGKYIYVEKYLPELDSYVLVAMGKSDDAGNDLIPLRMNDIWYRFIIKSYPNTIEFSSTPRKVTSTSLFFYVITSTFSGYLDRFENIAYSLTHNNLTNIFRLEFSTDGTIRDICLKVNRFHGADITSICDTCLTTASGTITCATGNETGTYTASAYANINPTKLIDSITTIISDVDNLSLKLGAIDSALIAFFIVGVISFLFLFSATVAFFMAIIALIVTMLMGLTNITMGMIILMIIALFLYVLIKRGD